MNWGKVIKRTLLVAAGVVVLVTGAAYVIVHTKAFGNFVLEKVIQEAESGTGPRAWRSAACKSTGASWPWISTGW